MSTVKVTATVESRKSAHSKASSKTASFTVEVQGYEPEAAVKMMAQVFPKEDGYKVEAVAG
jgi:hypothetical protein